MFLKFDSAKSNNVSSSKTFDFQVLNLTHAIKYHLSGYWLEIGLLSIIRKIKKKEKEMRILMVPQSYKNLLSWYTLNIWDVGGQRSIRSYWRNYFEQTDGLVWVVDSSDLRRVDDCKMELDNVLKEERLSGASLLILLNKQDIKGALTPAEIASVYVLANELLELKALFHVEICSESVSTILSLVLNLEAMDRTRHWKIVGCSAYTGEGFLEGFDWLVQDIASRIYMLD
ncbi:hypothetical protein JRO89_XS14G0024000 [Xanthoceras sorbifolium]|uniref:ADP-ribosylation factor-like protein 2 n=1 Tax=Xanthoceras sorbifolium TaxID=99658 RepID=A0ABQ8H3E0_9ROSI|nr:hypothetical protein JRO89_XS14G0024000 [Xanthoceras sorbifolium]